MGPTRLTASTDDITTILGDTPSGELNASVEALELKTVMTGFITDPGDPRAIGFIACFER